MMDNSDAKSRQGRNIASRAGREGDILAGYGPPSAEPEDDPIDRLGTKIGRALGIVITIGLMIWFVVTIFNTGP